MIRRLLLAVAIVLPTGMANACGIVVGSDFRDAVGGAESVFVFHVTSLELYHEGGWPSFKGSIEITETLHGPKPRFNRVDLDGICSDIRLDVDGYYVAATSQVGRTLRIETMDPSVINVSNELYLGTDIENRSISMKALRAYFRGTPLPEQFPTTESVQRMHGG